MEEKNKALFTWQEVYKKLTTQGNSLGVDFSQVILEEFKQDFKESNIWYFTVSDPTQTKSSNPILGNYTKYIKFRLEAESGEVLSMESSYH